MKAFHQPAALQSAYSPHTQKTRGATVTEAAVTKKQDVALIIYRSVCREEGLTRRKEVCGPA